uniref:Uncharacterized protein n=1 Tax=Pithovirus LCDPAC02 TaxID=2506601 RepID=A0A481YRC0_9VIRU|nr:MAG: hypothetical protein LCDPAC02_02050 [Pithovirus LCDPAC02]
MNIKEIIYYYRFNIKEIFIFIITIFGIINTFIKTYILIFDIINNEKFKIFWWKKLCMSNSNNIWLLVHHLLSTITLIFLYFENTKIKTKLKTYIFKYEEWLEFIEFICYIYLFTNLFNLFMFNNSISLIINFSLSTILILIITEHYNKFKFLKFVIFTSPVWLEFLYLIFSFIL